MNAIEEVFHLCRAMFVVALLATVPGYWFTVYFIDKIGRYRIQLGGFLLMSILMAILGYNYGGVRGEKNKCQAGDPREYCGGNPMLFAILYGLTPFFANFGINSTTFIVPTGLFPARFRSTAAGKAGAIIGAFVVERYTSEDLTKKNKKGNHGAFICQLGWILLHFYGAGGKRKIARRYFGRRKS